MSRVGDSVHTDIKLIVNRHGGRYYYSYIKVNYTYKMNMLNDDAIRVIGQYTGILMDPNHIPILL